MITEKKCKSCEKKLGVDFFSPSKNIKDGFENKCKACRQLQRKAKNTKVCGTCGVNFSSASKKQLFCSMACSSKNRRKREIRMCLFCGNDIEVVMSKLKKQDVFFCDQKCRTQLLKSSMTGTQNPNFSSVEYSCDGCRKKILVVPSKVEKQNYIFCSNKCYTENIGQYFKGSNNSSYRQEIELNCSVCGKPFKRKPGQLKAKKNYCSRSCYWNDSDRTKVRGKVEVGCGYCEKRFNVWESQRKLVQNIYCSKKCKDKHQSIIYKGATHPSWNPDISEQERITKRKYSVYNEWRTAVFERDGFTCQCCGDPKGGNLVAHHLLSYSTNINERTSVNNGVTLCQLCHKLFHDNFGYGNNDLDQYKIFIDIFTNCGVDGFVG